MRRREAPSHKAKLSHIAHSRVVLFLHYVNMFVHKIYCHQPFEIQKCQKAPVFTKMQISAPSLASLFQILKILSEKRASVKIVNFQSFFPGYCLFTGNKNIISKKLLYVTYSALIDQHDKLQYIVIEPVDFERPLIQQ